MTEMLDRATLAVLEVWQKSNAPVGTHLDCEAVARAVIETLREPSEAMKRVVDPRPANGAMANYWNLMIDAALNDAPAVME